MIMINILLLKNFNNFKAENVTARLAEANLARKKDIANFAKRQISIKNLNKNESNELSKRLKQYQQENQQKI